MERDPGDGSAGNANSHNGKELIMRIWTSSLLALAFALLATATVAPPPRPSTSRTSSA